MSFWVTKDYPLSPPLAYVNPTPTMQVAHNHEYASPDGSVFLPYLNQWNASRSNLNGLIATCKAVFSTCPPVHAKSAQTTGGPPSYSSYSQRPGYPSKPAETTPYNTVSPPPPYRKEPTKEELQQMELNATKKALQHQMQEKYRGFGEDMKKNLDDEISTQHQLELGQSQLLEGLKKLEKQSMDFDEASHSIRTKSAQLQSWLSEYEKKDDHEMSLDEAIVPADGPARQLFDCVSESGAIDDILFQLDRALSNDVIDLNTFLKEVRKLSRKQFMSRALAHKIQKHQQRVEIQNQTPPALNSKPPAYQSRYT